MYNTMTPVLILLSLHAYFSEKYIVSVNPTHFDSFKTRMSSHQEFRSSLDLEHFEFSQLKGFVGTFTNKTISELMNDEAIEYIEKDSLMYAEVLPYANHLLKNTTDNTNGDELLRQLGPKNWGLQRISSRSPFSSTSGDYLYYSNAGEDVDVYVIDTGVNYLHPEFNGRAKILKNFVDDIDEDLNGHGTHVSGIIASKSYGVSKKATVKALKVLGADGSGSTSGIIMAMQYVIKNKDINRKSVINMSLGGTFSKALNDAVESVYEAGIPIMVAAGNDGKDACGYSPASAKNAYTVGNTDKMDRLHYSSNYGKCVDINAPGSDIMSTFKDTTAILTGTSMASPHVAGVAALLISANKIQQKTNNFAQDVYDSISMYSNKNTVLTKLSTTDLLYNRAI